MDGTSTMGPPGPRGPPGRVEVLTSVSITQVKALPHAFRFAKGGGEQLTCHFRTFEAVDYTGCQGLHLPACQPLCSYPLHATTLPHTSFRVCSSAGQGQEADNSLESTGVLRKPQISAPERL